MALNDYTTALVTGASSGIGRAVVERLAARGLRVHAVARRKQRLDSLAKKTGCVPHVIDVRDLDAMRFAFEDEKIDVLVNNAGVGRGHESLMRASDEDIEATLHTNIDSIFNAIRVAAPSMIARDRGHIVNMGSWAGLYGQGSTLYGATKGAVHLLSQNLRLELLGSAIRVTEICPGRVRTEFAEKAFRDTDFAREFNKAFRMLSAEDVADAVMYALDTPWHVNVTIVELCGVEQATGGVQVKRGARRGSSPSARR
ncbi:MAG TPA: SDR family oxidoreductase [Rhodospirillales bacterium]|jgi:NADP-dependent 3-hydroxy acid dehydrogenase YdfG|nr:SDR family oxidoreductase [Rhodospirillales bacterium]HJO69050.1 SDR family oxidoreductase [Rhodospirillales bacterium]